VLQDVGAQLLGQFGGIIQQALTEWFTASGPGLFGKLVATAFGAVAEALWWLAGGVLGGGPGGGGANIFAQLSPGCSYKGCAGATAGRAYIRAADGGGRVPGGRTMRSRGTGTASSANMAGWRHHSRGAPCRCAPWPCRAHCRSLLGPALPASRRLTPARAAWRPARVARAHL
jgi:hypothetical protein